MKIQRVRFYNISEKLGSRWLVVHMRGNMMGKVSVKVVLGEVWSLSMVVCHLWYMNMMQFRCFSPCFAVNNNSC